MGGGAHGLYTLGCMDKRMPDGHALRRAKLGQHEEGRNDDATVLVSAERGSDRRVQWS